jgi:hypothetical protein
MIQDEIAVSTVGKRQRNHQGGIPHRPAPGANKHKQQPKRDSSIEQQIAQLIERLERNSIFFDQNPPSSIPAFEASGKCFHHLSSSPLFLFVVFIILICQKQAITFLTTFSLNSISMQFDMYLYFTIQKSKPIGCWARVNLELF